MRPSEVLDHQAALIDFLDSRAYRENLQHFVEDMAHKGSASLAPGGAEEMGPWVRSSLRVAESFHVQGAMMPLLKAAAMDLDGSDYMVHERLPAEHGFLIFDEPWLTKDVWGAQIAVNALQWAHGSAGVTGNPKAQIPGIWLVNYTDVNDERDEVTRNLLEAYGDQFARELGRYHVNHIWFLPYEQRVGPFNQPTPEDYAKYAFEGQVLLKETPNEARMVVALFRLLSQVIVEVRDAPIDRATARRAKRMNLPQRVQVVKLRRKEVKYLNPAEGPTNVEWQHSWWVKGHWAWRHCGPEHPFAEPYEKGYHARVYIPWHAKGPQDKPLLITEKVLDLAR